MAIPADRENRSLLTDLIAPMEAENEIQSS